MFEGWDPAAAQLVQVLVTIALTFVMGIEREEKSHADGTYVPAGVRTFPIIGLLGYAMALLSDGNALPVALGFGGVAALLVMSYGYKLKQGKHGATTEMAVLAAYLVGALVGADMIWVATSVSVGVVLLLQAKAPLRQFAHRLPRQEVATFVTFLLLTAVILPALPNQEFTRFDLNPFRTWLIVVAVSGVSYISYVLQRLVRVRQTTLLTAVLGGAYSSTVATVVMSRRSRQEDDPRLHAGAIVMACGVMYTRMAVLLWIFNHELGLLLGPRLILLSLVACAAGYALAMLHRAAPAEKEQAEPAHPGNPLEITTALGLAALLVVITVVVQLAAERLGYGGVYALGALAGTVQVDPFVLSIAQTAGRAVTMPVAAVSVIIAAASNNAVKAGYAMLFGERRTGRLALAALALLTAASFALLVNL